MAKSLKSKTAFLTFSSKVLRQKTDFVNRLVDLLENECGVIIKHRWFDELSTESSQDVYSESLKEILKANIFIAEVTISSTGVGQQISYALQHKKPCFLLMNITLKKYSYSSFLKGTKSSLVNFIYYKDLADLEKKLCPRIQEINDNFLEKFNFLASRKIKEILYKESAKEDVSVSELLRQIVLDWADKNSSK